MRYLSLCSSLAALALVPLCACESLERAIDSQLAALDAPSDDEAAPAQQVAEQAPARAEQASAPRVAAQPPKALADRVKTTQSGDVHTTLLKDFDAVKRQQEEPVWCWAACTQMILAYNGVEATQTDIADRIHGGDGGGGTKIDPASRYEISCALNPDMDTLPFTSLLDSLPDDPGELEELEFDVDGSAAGSALLSQLAPNKRVAVEDLLAGHPAVVGLRGPEGADMGHAYVLIGAEYTKAKPDRVGKGLAGALGKLQEARGKKVSDSEERLIKGVSDRTSPDPYPATEVTLVDPWIGEVVTLTGAEFYERVDFVISRRMAREHLEEWQSIATVK